jgi:hypothetical protein
MRIKIIPTRAFLLSNSADSASRQFNRHTGSKAGKSIQASVCEPVYREYDSIRFAGDDRSLDNGQHNESVNTQHSAMTTGNDITHDKTGVHHTHRGDTNTRLSSVSSTNVSKDKGRGYSIKPKKGAEAGHVSISTLMINLFVCYRLFVIKRRNNRG